MGMANTIRGMLARGVVRLAAQAGVQVLQVEAWKDDVRDDIEHWEPLGLASVPSDGAEVLLAEIGAAADHTVALGVTDRRLRPKDLARGDTSLYSAHASRMDLTSLGAVLKGLRLLVQSGHVDSAGGYKTNGAAGLTGTVSIVATPTVGTPLVLLTATFAGGILTLVTTPVPWVVAPGDTLAAVWST